MRPIWKGAISFGMVTIPVKLYSATQDRDIRFRLLHEKDASPIAEKRFCVAEDREVPWDELARGFEVSRGEYVMVQPEELEEIAPPSAHTIEIEDFVELGDVDPIYFEKSYFLEPEDVGAKPFQLLRRALEETGRVAVARVTMRARERLATLRVYDDTIALETMYWPDEIRSTSGLEIPSDEKRQPSQRELQMARTLVENLSASFEPGQYHDRYREAVRALVDEKLKGEAHARPTEAPAPKVTDLMEALEASLNAAKASRAEAPARGGKQGEEAPAEADERKAPRGGKRETAAAGAGTGRGTATEREAPRRRRSAA